MRNLLIIGARGYGREVYNLFRDCCSQLTDIKCKGYLDDKTDALEGYKDYPPIISSVENYSPQPHDVFICALGEPKWKKHYTEIIKSKGGKFLSLYHPTALIYSNTIGEGCIIGRYAYVSCDIRIGNHNSIGAFSAIGHDVKIGDFNHLGAYTFMGGFSHIDNEVTVHPRVNILPHKHIGNNAVIGAGSVVIRNVASGITVFGNPAKQIN